MILLPLELSYQNENNGKIIFLVLILIKLRYYKHLIIIDVRV
jgi:hypothetical protein